MPLETSNQLEEALAQAREGSPQAFGRLVTAYQQKLYGFLLSYTAREDVADELTQETFIKAWQSIGRFRGESAFQTWLFQIAVNTVRSWGRWEKVRRLKVWQPQDNEDPMPEPPDPRADADPAAQARRADMRRHLQAAIQRLPPREKEVFLLRHEQDMALAEIAAALDLAEGTVKAHLFHAVAKMRKYLKGEIHDL